MQSSIYNIWVHAERGKKNLRLLPPHFVGVEMFESTPLFKFHLHRKDIGEILTSDSGAG